MPEYYGLIRAARYLGVPPWELAEQPIFWQDAALLVEGAELEAQEVINNPEKFGQWQRPEK